jgi:hypothetical protein
MARRRSPKTEALGVAAHALEALTRARVPGSTVVRCWDALVASIAGDVLAASAYECDSAKLRRNATSVVTRGGAPEPRRICGAKTALGASAAAFDAGVAQMQRALRGAMCAAGRAEGEAWGAEVGIHKQNTVRQLRHETWRVSRCGCVLFQIFLLISPGNLIARFI